MHKFLIKIGGQQYEALFPSSCDALTDALERNPGAAGAVVIGADRYASQYPDPCPDTGRRLVSVAEWNDRPDALIDEYAYWYSPEAAEMGLDPWRLIEGIDAHMQGRAFDVDFANGTYHTTPGHHPIYIAAKHYEALKCSASSCAS